MKFNIKKDVMIKMARTYGTKQHPYRTSIDLMSVLEKSSSKK